MTNSPSDKAKKKANKMNLVIFGLVAFVLTLGAAIFSAFSSCLIPMLFPSQYKVAFDKGVARAKINRPEGIQMMEAALSQCEKSSEPADAKSTLYYRYGAWNFNEVGLPDRFATSKKAYSKAAELSGNITGKAMALGMMADCDYYGRVVADGEKNAEQALKLRQSGGGSDPGSMWCTLQALGRAYMNSGHYDKAVKAFSDAREQAKKGELYEGSAALDSAESLACAYALAGRRDLGDALFYETIRARDRRGGVGNSNSEDIIIAYARALKKLGDDKSAQTLLSRLDDPHSMDNYEPGWKAFGI